MGIQWLVCGGLEKKALLEKVIFLREIVIGNGKNESAASADGPRATGEQGRGGPVGAAPTPGFSFGLAPPPLAPHMRGPTKNDAPCRRRDQNHSHPNNLRSPTTDTPFISFSAGV